MHSDAFDDIYFSTDGGLDEKRHVFLTGNGLPQGWAGVPRFCICETGFGTGLNMLAAWQAFEDTAEPTQRLDLVSIEKFPLERDQIRQSLRDWPDLPGDKIERLLALYPMRVPGFHRLDLSPRVSLTLVFDDVQNALPAIEAQVDAWFLDGFSPSKNPAMWSREVFANMARLSHDRTRLATYTAAGDVRRGLEEAGFTIEKAKGFGRKRHMITGRFTRGGPRRVLPPPRRVLVVGAGIAGISAAWHLRREGVEVSVYDQLPESVHIDLMDLCGIVNPKLTARRTPHSDYYTAAFAYAQRVIAAYAAAAGLMPHGSLHLQNTEDKARRFSSFAAHLGWDAAHLRLLDPAESSDAAGTALTHPCLFFPQGAAIRPRRLMAAMAQELDVHWGRFFEPESPAESFDAVVLANASAVTRFASALPVSPVRGQVSLVSPCEASLPLKANLCYGGYFTPLLPEGYHFLGATFQPWGTSPEVLPEDHDHNLKNLHAAVPALDGIGHIQSGRAGFRAASRDRFPVVGCAGGYHFSVAHGSHGIISGLMAGAITASRLFGAPMPVGNHVLAALDPARFDNR